MQQYGASPAVHSYPAPFCHEKLGLGDSSPRISSGTCVLTLWVLPFLLPAASRRHSRSTSALSTAESVGQSGEQVLTA